MKKLSTNHFHQIVSRIIDQIEYAQHLTDEAPFFPKHIHIEPTNSCNLNCIHCIQKSMSRKRGLMEWDVYTRIIDEIAPLDCDISLDVQGEPLLHPKIIQMIAYAKEKGCFVSLLTNGTRLSEAISRSLINLNLDRIVISFDAVEKELYEKVRINASFEKTLFNILKFIELNYINKQQTFICMSIILQKATETHIDTYKNYFNSLPINTIFISQLLNMSGGSIIADEINLTEKKKRPLSEWPICRIGWENLTINWDGTVCPCPLDYNVFWPLGNIKEIPLYDMWNSKKLKQFRRAQMDHNYLEIERKGTLCSQCSCLWDPEYDMKQYKNFAKQAIVRLSSQYAKSLSVEKNDLAQNESDSKYQTLLNEICRYQKY